jgi:hypothetical protein
VAVTITEFYLKGPKSNPETRTVDRIWGCEFRENGQRSGKRERGKKGNQHKFALLNWSLLWLIRTLSHWTAMIFP